MARITLLSGWYYPDSTGGTEAYVHALARDLLAMGHEVRVAAPAVDVVEREYVHDGVSVYRYPVSLNPNQSEVQGSSPPAQLRVFEDWLRQQAPEIVHSHSFTRGCGVYHLASACRLGSRTMVTVHTPDVVCGRGTLMRWGKTPCDGVYRPVRCAACCLQQRGVPLVAALPIALWPGHMGEGIMPNGARTAVQYRHLLGSRHHAQMQSLRQAELVVAVSQWLYDMLAVAGVPMTKLRLSRQGVTDELTLIQRGPARSQEPLRIAYVGRLDPVKGVDVLMRAFCKLPHSHRIELHVYGGAQGVDGDRYESRLRELAKSDNRIVFHGVLRPDDRRRVFAGIDLLAVPSVWFETGPLVVLEAFAAGIPVLGSDIGGIPERVRHGVSGWLVPPGDARAWTAAMDRLYKLWQGGNWRWTLSQPRSSRDVAREMDELYRGLLAPPLATAYNSAIVE